MNKFVYVFCALLSLLLLSCTGNTAGLPDTRNAELVSLAIAGKAVELAQPAADAVSAGMAGVTLTEAEASGATIEYTAKTDAALVRYCRVASGDTVLAWKRSGAVNFFNEDIFVIQVSSGAAVLYYKVQIQIETTPFEPPAENTGDLCGKVLILQAYGTGSKNDGGVSHSFIELYNKSGSEADLSGYTLQYSQGGVNWTVMDLSGRKIPSGCSFLVLGKQMNARSDLAGTGLLQLDPAHADMVFPDLQIDNNEFKIFLVQGTDALAVRNPFDVKGNRSGVKADGYTDLLGVNDTDETKSIDAFETSELTNAAIQAPYYASKGKSIRRITLIDTDDNSRDFQRVEWRTNQAESISPAEFEAFRPRSSKDGAWNPVYIREPVGDSSAQMGSVKIAGQSIDPGTPAAVYSAVVKPGTVTLSSLIAGSVPIAPDTAPGASVRTAKVSGNGAPVWGAALAYSFADGDFLYIEVTSKDGRNVNVYKIAVGVTQASGTVTVSGSYALELNSTIPQQSVSIEAYADNDGRELVARTAANPANKTWSMQAPVGQALWFAVSVSDTAGYTFGKIVSQSAQTFGADTGGIALTLGPFAAPQLTAFTLLGGTAQNGVVLDKIGSINQSTGEISFEKTNYQTVSVNTILYYYKLAANFTLAEGCKLYVGDTEQASGVTPNNYYKDVVFTVVAQDNARKTYTTAGQVLNQGSAVSGTDYTNTVNRVVGTGSWQTQGFGVMNITTTDATLGMPSGITGKLNIVWNPTGTFTYISPEGRVVEGGTSIKEHGNYSVRHDDIKSYSLKLNDAAGFDYYDYKTGKCVTLPDNKRWVLLAHPGDDTRIRTPLAFEMGRRVLTYMGWQPHADWVFFFLNGEYKGLYILSEVIKIDSGRIDIGPEASSVNPDGGFVVQFNNYIWYANDDPNGNNQFVFDGLYNFMTSHQNPVNNGSGGDGDIKYQGVAWTFSSPDSDIGWYYPDPPLGDGHLTYADTVHQPRVGIVLQAKLQDGDAYNRASRPAAEWTVPDDFGMPNGMGTPGMLLTGTLNGNNGGVYGDRTVSSVYPGYNSSAFVKMSQRIQNAEDAIYSHDWIQKGTGTYLDYIDIDSFIDWQISQEMVSNFEVIILNGEYMYYDPSVGKLKMGPIWDFDQGWSRGTRGTVPGFVRKIPFWYKELLGWEMVTGSEDLSGNERPELKDPFYVSRLKARWAQVKGQFGTELNQYLNAEDTRFIRISGYSQPISINGSRTGLIGTISDMVTRLDAVFNSY